MNWPGRGTAIRRALLAAALLGLAGCRIGGDAVVPAPGEPCGPAAIVAAPVTTSEGEVASDDPLAAAAAVDDDGLPGFPHSLAIDPDEPSRAWFTIDRGLLVTADGGATWEPLQSTKIEQGRAIVALRPPGGDLFVAGPGVLRRSADDGATWIDLPGPGPGPGSGSGEQQAPSGSPTAASAGGDTGGDRDGETGGETSGDTDDVPVGPDIRGLATDPTDGRTLLALLGDGRVVASDDGGAAWTTAGERAPAGAYGLWPVAAEPTVLWTVSLIDRSVCASPDGGASWAKVEPAGLVGQLQNVALADDGVAYAATIAGLYRSADRGATWEARGPFRAVIGVATRRDASDTVLALVFGGSVYRSEDGGLTWGGGGE